MKIDADVMASVIHADRGIGTVVTAVLATISLP